MNPSDRRPRPTSALGSEFVHPGRGRLRAGVSRQIVAVTLVSTVILFSGKVLDVLGDAREVIGAVGATLLLAGAVAGALYHPVRRFWWRGAVAGMAATGGSFLAARLYGRVRPDPFGHEFAVVALLGAIPGIMMYYWLMKGQLVTTSEVARLRGAAEQGDEADER